MQHGIENEAQQGLKKDFLTLAMASSFLDGASVEELICQMQEMGRPMLDPWVRDYLRRAPELPSEG